jgi:hypothetical protein
MRCKVTLWYGMWWVVSGACQTLTFRSVKKVTTLGVMHITAHLLMINVLKVRGALGELRK